MIPLLLALAFPRPLPAADSAAGSGREESDRPGPPPAEPTPSPRGRASGIRPPGGGATERYREEVPPPRAIGARPNFQSGGPSRYEENGRRRVPAAERAPLAGTLVRSREYVVRRTPRETEEFVGDVLYRHGPRELRADWARHDRELDSWELRGRVRASLRLDDGGVLEAAGERAAHEGRSGRGWLAAGDGPIGYAYRSGGGERDSGSARRLDWDQPAAILRLSGDVRVRGLDGEGRSDSAEYRRGEDALLLDGRRPVLLREDAKWASAVQADRIRLDRADGRVEADGAARGWLRFPPERPPRAPRRRR